jgi:hypothetical protein
VRARERSVGRVIAIAGSELGVKRSGEWAARHDHHGELLGVSAEKYLPITRCTVGWAENDEARKGEKADVPRRSVYVYVKVGLLCLPSETQCAPIAGTSPNGTTWPQKQT